MRTNPNSNLTRKIVSVLAVSTLLISSFHNVYMPPAYAAGTWDLVSDQSFAENNDSVKKMVADSSDSIYMLMFGLDEKSIYVYQGGDLTLVTGDFISDSHYTHIIDMAFAGESLYVAFGTPEGNELWSYDGSTWTEITSGLPSEIVYILGMDQTDGSPYMWAMTEIEEVASSVMYLYDGEAWEAISDVDSFGDYDPVYLNIVYMSSVMGGIIVSFHDTMSDEFMVFAWDPTQDFWLQMGDTVNVLFRDIIVYDQQGLIAVSWGNELYAYAPMFSSEWLSTGPIEFGEDMYGPRLLMFDDELYVSMSHADGGDAQIFRFNREGDPPDWDIESAFVGGENLNIDTLTDMIAFGDTIAVASAVIGEEGPESPALWLYTPEGNPDIDEDGVETVIENAAPNGGDANDDGTADSLQENVASFVNPVTNQYSVLEVPDICSITELGVTSESNNSTQDIGFDYPLGMMNFTIDCDTTGFSAEITQYYFGAEAEHVVMRKYNPTNGSYMGIDSADIEEVMIGGELAVAVTFTIVDGGVLDVDGDENGVIRDPSGLGISALTVPTTGMGGTAR